MRLVKMAAHTNAYTLSAHAIVVAFFVMVLIYIDHETKGVADVFQLRHLPAFAVYFVPTYLLTISLHDLGKNKLSRTHSFFVACCAGIPLAFALIIAIFLRK
jgi:hypothetical protein